MKLIILLIILVCIILFFSNATEGFSAYGPYIINSFKGGLGSTPAGVNALPGAKQKDQNAHAFHVAAVQPGNPQSARAAFNSFKVQPML
jgi:hypothetical protein